jgi:NADPH-dependent curcumin reductase
MRSLQVRLKSTPSGVPMPEHFSLDHADLPALASGQVLVEVLDLSLDPYMRGQISGRHMSGRVDPGMLMNGETVVRVLESKADGVAEGLVATARAGWQSHAVLDAATLVPIGFAGLPPSLALGVLGMPGLTAFAGVNRLLDIRPGDTLVVSAAAGPVGSMVGQLAKIKGARVVGIAGGADKCAWVIGSAGFDACVDYKAAPLRDGLDAACPVKTPGLGGIDAYFDNVGGDVLQAAMERLNLGARVALCGLMEQYNADVPPPGPNPAFTIKARAHVHGLVVYDHEDLRARMLREVAPWIRGGAIAWKEDVAHGLEQAPAAFERLMRGQNFGKMVVKVAAS